MVGYTSKVTLLINALLKILHNLKDISLGVTILKVTSIRYTLPQDILPQDKENVSLG